jgi:hypothetical protein
MRKLAVLCLLAMATMALAKSTNSKIFKSVRAVHDVAVESNADSAFWRGAMPVNMSFDNWGKSVGPHRTEVRSRWTKDNLYFLFICPYTELNLKPNPSEKTETNKLWNWDVAEAFIGSDFHNIRRYKEFEMSPQGEWIDLDINLDSPHHEDGWMWNSGFQVSAHIDRQKKIWYGAMRVPFTAIDPQTPHTGSIFRLNMFRTEGAAPNTKSNVWQPTMKQTFHVPERFGQLQLVDSK